MNLRERYRPGSTSRKEGKSKIKLKNYSLVYFLSFINNKRVGITTRVKDLSKQNRYLEKKLDAFWRYLIKETGNPDPRIDIDIQTIVI